MSIDKAKQIIVFAVNIDSPNINQVNIGKQQTQRTSL